VVLDLPKIPTELWICIPRRSSIGAFHTNIWANLTRRDTGEGIGGKRLLSFLDGVNVSEQYTAQITGYAGPFDINPQTVGPHKTYVVFEGDAILEPCKSEEITLTVDPNLLRTEIKMGAPVTDGYGVQVTGTAYEIAPDGSRRKPAYPLPLDLMVFDNTSTKRLKPVKTSMTNPDGTYTIDYTFPKIGKYAIFVNFIGDAKYCSAWSNNGRTTTINIIGGGLPLSFDKSVTVAAKETKMFRWILGSTEPTAPDGYARFPDLDLDFGILGKYWAFIKVTSS